MRTFNNEEALKSFLKKEAAKHNMTISNAYTTFFARELLYRLSKDDRKDSLILKGSATQIAYLGRLSRAIVDLDIATELPNRSEAFKIIVDALLDNNDSNIKYEFKVPIKESKTGIYQISLLCEYGKLNQVLKMDFQRKYNRLIEKELRVMPPIFDGDEEYELYMPSYEEFLAEKLCIILEEGINNTRVKDFYDVYELHGGKYDRDKFSEYFVKMLTLRNKISLEDANKIAPLLNNEYIKNREAMWDSSRKHYSFMDPNIDLTGAVYYTRGILREQLQKAGAEMPNYKELILTPNNQKRPY